MARILVHKEKDSTGRKEIRVYWDSEWEEFITKFYGDGQYLQNCDSHCTDKQEAIDTGKAWYNFNR